MTDHTTVRQTEFVLLPVHAILRQSIAGHSRMWQIDQASLWQKTLKVLIRLWKTKTKHDIKHQTIANHSELVTVHTSSWRATSNCNRPYENFLYHNRFHVHHTQIIKHHNRFWHTSPDSDKSQQTSTDVSRLWQTTVDYGRPLQIMTDFTKLWQTTSDPESLRQATRDHTRLLQTTPGYGRPHQAVTDFIRLWQTTLDCHRPRWTVTVSLN